MKWTVQQVRKTWIEYFQNQDHLQIASSSLYPIGDPTLLFTTAGMVQFKPYFSGTEAPPHPRAVSIQKCLRTTDLECVGKTARHCTFFEMLGNFSFDDYFKKEAIHFAYDFSLNHLKFDPEKIYISVYEQDSETETIWREQEKIPANRIVHLGKADNWWGPTGDSGPCGPCTELYLDRGPQYCSCPDPAACAPGSECDRFMEYWNLVLNQYHQDTSGKLTPLPATGIDTGAGLERIVALLNTQDSVYDTDEMMRIIARIEALVQELHPDGLQTKYTPATAAPFRVLTDHVRSASFCIGDGIYPDNTGRGYVIRRLIRRALLFARELGVHQPLLHQLVPTVVEIYGSIYPELKEKAAEIQKRILMEEERFLHTLEHGIKIWDAELAEHRSRKATIFDGGTAFRLYDTYGFPLEMTRELAEKEGLTVDLAGFETHMQKQRDMTSAATRWKDWQLPPDGPLPSDHETIFSGYTLTEDSAQLLAILQNDQYAETLSVGENSSILVFERTPFYAESGGQVGDTGEIRHKSGAIFRVRDTRKSGSVFLHIGEMLSGRFSVGDQMQLTVDSERRAELRRHHSATHLLNKGLRDLLGDHVAQTGSLVASDYLRFDFSHPEKVPAETLRRIEENINTAIRDAAPVSTRVLPIDEARELGAVAAFGEKYGAMVRIVSMGTASEYSLEFCGGCHVDNTADIQYCHIVKESSPGAGNRRIEAVAGERVRAFFGEEFQKLGNNILEYNRRVRGVIRKAAVPERPELLIAESVPDHEQLRELLGAGPLAIRELSETQSRLHGLLQKMEKEFGKFQKQLAGGKADELLSKMDEVLATAQTAGSVEYIVKQFQDQDPDALRKFGDALKERRPNIVLLFGNVKENKPLLIFMTNQKPIAAGVDCGKLIKATAGQIGGGGGGSPHMARAGGRQPEHLAAALQKAAELLKIQVGESPAK